MKALPEPRPDTAVIARKWKGGCDPGQDPAHRVTCNNKVIGAQYFEKGIGSPTKEDWASPMDAEGHGTHTATTAAGDYDVPARVPSSGISGRISGIAPAARIAVYKACWAAGCPAEDTIAAFDKAVADGVDAINFSVGNGNGEPADSPSFMAMFNAAKAGVFISASAGNEGPGNVDDGVPWVTTVAASSHDLAYRTTVTLGNGTSYHGIGVSASAVPSSRLVDAAKAARKGVAPDQAALCEPDTLDPAKVKGAIVLCTFGGIARDEKSAVVQELGGVGMVLYYTGSSDDAIAEAHHVPTSEVGPAVGKAVKAYAGQAGGAATAKLSAARAVHRQAPAITGFSSSGPDLDSGGNLLKPDIAGPGLDIVAGVAAGGTDGDLTGSQGLMSGTSMAAPHVAGLALLLRELHPAWSPMEIKSALMTTATTRAQAGRPIGRDNVTGPATPLDYGAGQIVPNTADDPGLVYDSTSADWTAYICSVGEKVTADDGGDACATAKKIDPSDLNSASIAVGSLAGKQTVTRTVTNVSATTGFYTATVQTPPGYKTRVSPKKLVVPPGRKATYKVTFTRTHAAYGTWAFGAVTWSDHHHKVRSTVALRAVGIRVPGEATGRGATGSVPFTATPGVTGTLTTDVNGLYAGTTNTGTLTGTDQDFDPAKSTSATARTEVTVPKGIRLARIAIRSADFLQGSDEDLYVFDKDGNLLSDPGGGSDEHLDLTKPGTYTVYVSQYGLPQGVSSQKYILHTWLIGADSKPDVQATADPVEQPVTMGSSTKVTVSWSGLPAGRTYFGLVDYRNGSETLGTTILTVTP
ncbi:S8 family serine peptidase [Streptomyces sp. DG2A-72]|uniref:S8 family serine peptidase n=1 Tax=Streptomyces sp. DG2A-72 TaxID=3051386 RepID=UPI00265BBCAA|nr:S8 family serine peptidase [Streptomyces sp. DG2A-72]MDO0934916.1 S8 family serine peptidase [Streptomyces sp. DG2A-72]